MTAIKMLFGPAVAGGWTFNNALNTLTAHTLNDSDNAIAWQFVVPVDGSITKVGFLVTATAGTPPAFNVGLVTVDSAGAPTTTAYGGSAITSWTPGGTGWVWVTLSTAATGAAGDIVAVHVYPGATAPTGANNISIAREVLMRVMGDGDNGIPAMRHFTTVWNYVSGLGPMAVQYSNGDRHGLALDGVSDLFFDDADSPDEVGCKFTLPVQMKCYGCVYPVSSNDTNASWDVKLYDADSTLQRSMTIDDEDRIGPSNKGLLHAFWDEITLNSGVVYRLAVRATHGTQRVKVGILDFNATDDKNFLPEGANWQLTTRANSGAWTDTAGEMPPMGLYISDVTLALGGVGAYGFVS